MDYINKKYPNIGFAGIIVGIFLFFLFAPLLIDSPFGIEFAQLCLVVTLIATLYVLGGRWGQVIIGLMFAIPFLLIDFYSIQTRQPHMMAIAYSFFCVFLFYAIVVLGRYILFKRHIDTNLIFAVITLYILSGMLWAKLYYLQDFIFPDSFKGVPLRETATNLKAAVENQYDFLYYSFATLTTLGLGDIVPVHHLARSLTVSEAVFGQLFVAIVISKMVSLWRHDLETSC